jgi:hypothetical protein
MIDIFEDARVKAVTHAGWYDRKRLESAQMKRITAVKVVAGLWAKACASWKKIDPAPFSSESPSPTDGSSKCSTEGRNHRNCEIESGGTCSIIRRFTV